MEQYFLWCYQCSNFSTNNVLVCALCNSSAVEQRLSNSSNSLQNLDASLNLLSERLASLVQALQDLTNRVNSNPKKLPATDEMINGLEWADSSPNECSICMESQISPMRILPCGHKFHNECLIPWLKLQRTCPHCRHELIEN
jgi:Ring finger domain